MKKTIILVLALSLVIAGMATAGIVSSKHDMRNNVNVSGRTIKAGNSTTSQVCVFCHHPHRGSVANVSSILLWNISDGAGGSYMTYQSPTTGAVTSTNASNQASLLCMGCHDGDSATNVFLTKPSDGTLGSMINLTSLASNLGSTLQEDHPIEFTYPTLAATAGPDIQLASGDTVTATNGATYPLFGSTMQCSTCHSVHDAGSQAIQFMRGTVANSEICVDCHTAK